MTPPQPASLPDDKKMKRITPTCQPVFPCWLYGLGGLLPWGRYSEPAHDFGLKTHWHPDQPEAPKETPDEKTVVIRADPNAPSKPAVAEETIAREARDAAKKFYANSATTGTERAQREYAFELGYSMALSRSNSSDTKKPLLDKLVADMRSIKDAANENGAGNPPDGYMDLEPKETSVADACYQHGMDVMEIAVLNWIHDQQAARDSSDTPKGEALVDLLEQLLFAAENADETGYVTDVGFIKDFDALHDRCRSAIDSARANPQEGK